jgi:O-antigen biosynthesis protein
MSRIKVVDVECSEAVTDVAGLDGYEAVQALVRLRRRPIGYVMLPVIDGSCSGDSLEAAILAAYGNLLQDRHAARMPPTSVALPSVTVAICTRDNPGELESCLDALCRVDHPDLEVLVVDNAPSTDATGQLVRSRFPAVRYVREPRPGLNWARNRAIVEASGEILAYTDDDVVVDPDWVPVLATAFAEDPDIAAVTGLVVPAELETPPQLHFERYGGFGCGFDRRRYSWAGETRPSYRGQVLECGTGANMAFRKEIFRRIGPFDPALDAGTAATGGGDLEMFFRVLKEGYTLVYEPAALVRHRHRREPEQLRSQIESWGTGTMAVLARSARAYPDERGRLMRLALRGLGRGAKRYLASWIVRPGFPRSLLLTELRGALAGIRRYEKARRQADEIARSAGSWERPVNYD